MQLTSLLSEITARNINQKHLFVSILNWINKDEETRKIYFAKLFQLMNLDNLTCKYLEKTIMTNGLVKDSNPCLNAVLAVFSKKFREGENDSKIICLGGKKQYQSITSRITEVHNVYGKTATIFPKLPMAVYGHSVQKMTNFIYCFGGADSLDNETDRAFRMNLCNYSMDWKRIVSMNEKRFLHASAVMNSKIVVVGSYNHSSNSKPSKSAELYDCQLNTW